MEAPISVIGFSSAFCAISISLNIMSTPSYPTTFRNFQLHQPQRLMKQCSFHYITIRGGLMGLSPEGYGGGFAAGCDLLTQTGCVEGL